MACICLILLQAFHVTAAQAAELKVSPTQRQRHAMIVLRGKPVMVRMPCHFSPMQLLYYLAIQSQQGRLAVSGMAHICLIVLQSLRGPQQFRLIVLSLAGYSGSPLQQGQDAVQSQSSNVCEAISGFST